MNRRVSAARERHNVCNDNMNIRRTVRNLAVKRRSPSGVTGKGHTMLRPLSDAAPVIRPAVRLRFLLAAVAVTLFLPRASAAELIVNGNFEAGPVGFTSAYLYSPGNILGDGTYDVVKNPSFDSP